ncbi:MAG: L-histidine N(alpha)-methyltransferase [Bacteroidales bacterium]
METDTQLSTFETDVLTGLSSNPRFLSSKYFYDANGSILFEKIMRMPEYYLTDCELEIFQLHKEAISRAFEEAGTEFDLIELGAGDGMKTKVLLAHLLTRKAPFKYIPVDISEQAVQCLTNDLKNEFPELAFEGLTGDYFQLIDQLNGPDRKIILFLGSNIGNFDHEQSVSFLSSLKQLMNPGDLLLVGFDLKKDSRIILRAYNDPHGLTAAFNINLLLRINRELTGDFNPDNFKHQEVYNPQTGTAKSYLISKTDQRVTIGKLNKTFYFRKEEPIFMEMSQKYDLDMIEALATRSGFAVTRNFFDSRRWFVNSLWRVNE